MKKIRNCIALLVIVCICFSGCTSAVESIKATVYDAVAESGIETPTRLMLDGLLSNDINMSLAAISSNIPQRELQTKFDELAAMLPEADNYTLTPTNINKKTSNGLTQTSVRFLMEIRDQSFLVDVSTLSNQEGLYSIFLQPYEVITVTGTIDTLGQCDVLQILFLVIAAAETVFVIWMFVDCCRHKMKYKAGYLILILMGNLILAFTAAAQNLHLQFQFGLFLTYSALLRYSSGEMMIRLFIPIGAIVYFSMRKRILAVDASSEESEEAAEIKEIAQE